MSDPLSAVVDLLKADIDVSAITTKVFGQLIPANFTANQACVLVVKTGGGLPNSMQHIFSQRIDLRTYGATPIEAANLQRLCTIALQDLERQIRKSTILFSATQLTGAYYVQDPTTNWNYEFSVWSIETYLDDLT